TSATSGPAPPIACSTGTLRTRRCVLRDSTGNSRGRSGSALCSKTGCWLLVLGRACRVLVLLRRRPRWPDERFVDIHRRPLAQVVDRLLGEIRPDLFLDLGTDFIERLRLVLFHQNQVIAELRLYRLGDLADWRCERSLFEW